MKKNDYIAIIAVLAVTGIFAFAPGALEWFNKMTREHGMIMSFFKFAILATFGEMLALRIRKGVYDENGFGILPRMLVWGFLGMGIAMAMTIFKSGTIAFLSNIGFNKAAIWFSGPLSLNKFFRRSLHQRVDEYHIRTHFHDIAQNYGYSYHGNRRHFKRFLLP